MAEEPKTGEKRDKSKMIVPNICLGTTKNNSHSSSSMPTTPVAMRKSESRYSCLCSPTTHAGSFRCRYHRNEGLVRGSMSIGSKLSELAGK